MHEPASTIGILTGLSAFLHDIDQQTHQRWHSSLLRECCLGIRDKQSGRHTWGIGLARQVIREPGALLLPALLQGLFRQGIGHSPEGIAAGLPAR